MKSRFLFAAAAAVALGMTSCSQDDVVEQSSFAKEKAITFGTYLSNAPETRGIVTTTTNLEEFGVTAFSTGSDNFAAASAGVPNFMYDQKLTKNSKDKWEYTPIKYWPTTMGSKVSFFAHSPIDSEYAKLSLATYEGTPYVNVKVADETKDMIDFVADNAMNLTHKRDLGDSNNEGVGDGEVKFVLQHEMTRLSFVACLDENLAKDNQTTVVIKSITLGAAAGFAKEGKYTFATEDDKRGTWELIDPVTSLRMNPYLDFKKNETYSGKTYPGYTIGLYGEDEVNLVDQAGDDAGIDAEKQYIFFIPSNETDGITNTNITVEYDIVTKDDKLMAGYSCTSSTKHIVVKEAILKQGSPYTFKLTFDVDRIKMDVSVTDWDKETTVSGTYTYILEGSNAIVTPPTP